MSEQIRRRFTAEERRQWVERFLQSGLTQREFATNHNLGLSNLQRWVAGKAPAFAEVTLSPLGASVSWTAEVVRPSGATLRLTNAVATGLLERLLRAC